MSEAASFGVLVRSGDTLAYVSLIDPVMAQAGYETNADGVIISPRDLRARTGGRPEGPPLTLHRVGQTKSAAARPRSSRVDPGPRPGAGSGLGAVAPGVPACS